MFQGETTTYYTCEFGSLGYAHIDDAKRTKFDAIGFRCMLLWYASKTYGYKVLKLENNKVKISRLIASDEREVGEIYEANNADAVNAWKVIVIQDEEDQG